MEDAALPTAIRTNRQEIDCLLEEWKTVIQTQMHFNEMILRLRGMGIATVTAIFGAAAYSLQFEKIILHVKGYTFQAAIIIVFFALTLLLAIFILDYFYYFKLLLGAVKRGEEIDKNVRAINPNMLGLTITISAFVSPASAKWLLIAFYIIPLVTGLAFILAILGGYTPKGEWPVH